MSVTGDSAPYIAYEERMEHIRRRAGSGVAQVFFRTREGRLHAGLYWRKKLVFLEKTHKQVNFVKF